MASRRLEERRSAYQRYKEDVKREGKPFYPYAMFHDTVMSLVVVSVIAGLAFIWHYTSLLGPSLAAKADPGTTSFVPRPDWYFYFLFYLLRIFKWPNSVILGTVGIPTILLILLLVIPFIDVRRERRLLRRLQGCHCEGAAWGGAPGGRSELGEGGESAAAGGPRRQAVRYLRLPQLPHLQRRRRLPARRAGPECGRVEEQGHRLPDRAPQMPKLCEQGLADAVLRGLR
ncbi:MAG: hypothetical protein AUG43_04285 [Actinobacteria bacterium 13_1_20CM_3_68_10]|nr:MAG: hypothetical protein AUG43_04285 [Actinobacteria bacterium 13_1_20CM_3_68_10]